jgi:hypothetical protein
VREDSDSSIRPFQPLVVWQQIAHEMRYLANALQKYCPEYRSKYIIFAALGAIAGMFKFCQMAHF